MSIVRRTPPSTPVDDGPHRVNSEPDLYNKSTDHINVLPRKKRIHEDTSPNKDFDTFRRELRADMMSMLRNWQDDQKELLNTMMVSQNAIFQKLASDVAEVKTQNKEIHSTNQEIEKSINFINKEFEDMKKKVENLEKERSELNQYTKNLETKLKDLQLSSRNSSIEVRNIPIKDKEAHSDLVSVISNIGRTIGCNIDTSEIRDIRRLPGKPGTTKPIVAEFVHVHTKQSFIAASKVFNKKLPVPDKLNTETIGLPGNRQPVYVAEYLSASSKRLLYLAREFAKENDYGYCWSSSGNIFLRKNNEGNQIIIRSEGCLRELRNQK
ncbi:unnamed protein product [Plutella xylostella]|uniref:(diamondback moth) hypothetical protein n=1 Tax=Plutella xylostella TaxID=51655 RepID=A0A8S4GAR6_PLUXY|nr:unnamed protein product [Plutella xylostella]